MLQQASRRRQLVTTQRTCSRDCGKGRVHAILTGPCRSTRDPPAIPPIPAFSPPRHEPISILIPHRLWSLRRMTSVGVKAGRLNPSLSFIGSALKHRGSLAGGRCPAQKASPASLLSHRQMSFLASAIARFSSTTAQHGPKPIGDGH